jgi:hydrogenase maturation protease
MAAKGILIGLGNPIKSDDAVGLRAASELHRLFPEFDLDLSCGGGLQVVDSMLGYEVAVVVDAMVTGRFPPGTAVRLDLEGDITTIRSGRVHGVNFIEAIEIAKTCGAKLPHTIVVYGIEVEDADTVGDEMSETLKEKLEGVVGQIAGDMSSLEVSRCTNSESPPR